MKNIDEIIRQATETINSSRARSAWERGVREYALDLVENLNQQGDIDPDDLTSRKLVERYLLNGAADWKQYSSGGCALIYNRDIARRLCTASELKRTRGGQREPNARETWIDVQARALSQAARLAGQVLTIYSYGYIIESQSRKQNNIEEETTMKIWYAVMMDNEDQDWGTGSFDLEEAKAMVRRNRENYPDSYIAVIEDGEDPVCIDEIHDIDD